VAKLNKKTGLEPREQRFVENYLENGGNATDAAKKAGYSDSYSRNASKNILGKPRIKTYLEKFFSKQGISERMHRAYMRLDQALDATRPMKFGTGAGMTVEQVEDWPSRLDAINKILKIKGDFSPEQHEHVFQSMFEGKSEDEKQQILDEADQILRDAQDKPEWEEE